MKQPTQKPVLKFEGTPGSCGKSYGESEAEAISAFLRLQVAPNAKRLGFARRCWAKLRKWEPAVVEFVRGLAEGSGLTLEETTLLLLHEEIAHTKSCTAFGAAGKGTRNGQPIIGQNWDWSSALYPWSSMVRIRSDAMPATMTYSYPGLWASAGINEHGLSLVWTSSGLYPKVPPQAGIPTYVLIAGILACGNCREAIDLVKRTANAGCFIFFIADAEGEVWVLEGYPDNVEAVQCLDVISRANHYECALTCAATRQRVPRPSTKKNTKSRARRMAELVQEQKGKISSPVAEAMLSDHGAKAGHTICQHPFSGGTGLTLDSFYALPAKKELRVARGSPCRHKHHRYRV